VSVCVCVCVLRGNLCSVCVVELHGPFCQQNTGQPSFGARFFVLI
jgi:hypothetical protein